MAARGRFVKRNFTYVGRYQNACWKYLKWASIVFIGWILLHMKWFMPFYETNMAAREQLVCYSFLFHVFLLFIMPRWFKISSEDFCIHLRSKDPSLKKIQGRGQCFHRGCPQACRPTGYFQLYKVAAVTERGLRTQSRVTELLFVYNSLLGGICVCQT